MLAVSLAGKLIANAPAPGSDPRLVAAPLEQLFRGAGYETRIVELERSPRIIVAAERGRCRMIAGDYPPHSTFEDVYRDLAAPIGRLVFVHRGTVYEEAPKLRGLFDYFLWRELRRIGVGLRRSPVIAVAASDSCALGDIPWENASSVES
jgi:hypothetical protein